VVHVQAEDIQSNIFNNKTKNMREKYIKAYYQKNFIRLICC